MGVFLCIVIPVIAFIVVMLVCKWSNFSIIPKDLRLKSPKKYKFPKISRGEDYKWEVLDPSSDEESSDEEDDILFDYSESTDSDSDNSSESSDSDTEPETVFF